MFKELSKSNFMKMLGKHASNVIKETWSEKVGERGYTPSRELRPDEEYVRSVLLSAGELVTICNQLHHAVSFVGNFRSTEHLKSEGIKRFDYILYHIENHLIRAVATFDRTLILVNEIFMLGNEPKNCKAHVIMSNRHVALSNVYNYLKELDKHLRPYREPRNTVIHKQRYKHEDLYWIECMHILDNEPNDVVPIHMLKRLTDVFVKERKNEMIKFNQELESIMVKLFGALEVEFQKKHSTLSSTGAV